MKKIFLSIFFLLLLLPVTSVFAQDVDVIKGVTPVNLRKPIINFANAVDGDPVTYASYDVKKGEYPFEFYYDFTSNPVTINSFRFNTDFTGTTSNSIRIQAVKANGTDITVANYVSQNILKDNSVHVLNTPLTDIVKLRFYATKGVDEASYKIYEMNFYTTVLTENPEPEKFVINNLSVLPTSNSSLTLKWDSINSSYLKSYKVYQDDILIASPLTNSFSLSSLIEGQTYVYKVSSLDTFGKEFVASKVTYVVPIPDIIPPAIPNNLKVISDRYTASVSSDPVGDVDLAGYHVFVDGNRVTTSPVPLPYVIKGLSLDTNYEVQIASIDLSGNLSDKSSKVSFRTLSLESVPTQVTSLTANPFNGGASLSWIPVASAKKYKVYMNDNFLLDTNQTHVKINNLVNGQQVSFYVIASNDIGDSEPSNIVQVMPLISLPPDVSLGYSLKDVADASSYWFSSMWLILAFSISIPLAFYLGNRVKGLFVT